MMSDDPLEAQIPEKPHVYRRPLNGDPTKISRMGSGKLGAVVNGAAGGGSTSTMMILAQEPASLLAREMGCTTEQAMKFMMAFGRVTQGMLLTGKPVGIPHIGIIVLQAQRRRAINRHILAKAMREGKCKSTAGLKELERLGFTLETVNAAYLVCPRSMHRFFADNAVYNGHWRLHFIEACKGHRHVTRAKINNKYRESNVGRPDPNAVALTRAQGIPNV